MARESEKRHGHERQTAYGNGSRAELVEHHARDGADKNAHRGGGKHRHARLQRRRSHRGLQQNGQNGVGDQACRVDKGDDDGGNGEIARFQAFQVEQAGPLGAADGERTAPGRPRRDDASEHHRARPTHRRCAGEAVQPCPPERHGGKRDGRHIKMRSLPFPNVIEQERGTGKRSKGQRHDAAPGMRATRTRR